MINLTPLMSNTMCYTTDLEGEKSGRMLGTDAKTDRQTDRQRDRQTDRHTFAMVCTKLKDTKV
jgi:hypothetical protein